MKCTEGRTEAGAHWDATLIFLALSSPNFKECKSSEDVDERQ